jgi:hypothetical protein
MIIRYRYSHFRFSFTLLDNLTRKLDKNVCNNQVLLVSRFFPYDDARTTVKMICKSLQTLDPSSNRLRSSCVVACLACPNAPMTPYPLCKNPNPLVCRKPIFNPSSAFRRVKLYNRRKMSSDVQIPSSQNEIIPGKGKSMAEIDETQRRKEAAIRIDVQNA